MDVWSRTRRESSPKRRPAGILAVVAAVMTLLPVIAAGSPADAAGPPWTIQPTPNPGSFNLLSGVSCPSATRCLAAGFDIKNGGDFVLPESWNGRRWSVTVPVKGDPLRRTRHSVVSAVSCPATTRCELVGVTGKTGTLPLAAVWNGKLGTASVASQRVADPRGSKFATLNGVSCSSVRACTAVGFYIDAAGVQSLVERWGGLRWRIQASGTITGQFNAVSCSSASFCLAVGDFGPTGQASMAAVWTGGAWQFVLGGNFSGATSSRLNGVSCTAGGSCVMAGDTSGPNGSSGTFALALTWSNGRLGLLSTANPSATDNVLNSVSCLSPGNCLAVGSFQDFRGQQHTLAERWDGATWAYEATPDPVGTLPQLLGVSCPKPGICTAIGSFKSSGGRTSTLAERFANDF